MGGGGKGDVGEGDKSVRVGQVVVTVGGEGRKCRGGGSGEEGVLTKKVEAKGER